jgi:hypothetical protein
MIKREKEPKRVALYLRGVALYLRVSTNGQTTINRARASAALRASLASELGLSCASLALARALGTVAQGQDQDRH